MLSSLRSVDASLVVNLPGLPAPGIHPPSQLSVGTPLPLLMDSFSATLSIAVSSLKTNEDLTILVDEETRSNGTTHNAGALYCTIA